MKSRSEALEKVFQGLKAEEHRLEQELAETQSREKSLVTELKKVRSALQALGDREKPLDESAKGTMNIARVKEVVLRALSASAPMSLEALKAEVLKAAKAQGCSGTGLHQVLRRVLQDPSFEETSRGYALKGGAGEAASGGQR